MNVPPNTAKPQRLLTFAQIAEERGIPFTRQYLSKLEAKGRFPRRVRIGDRWVAWSEAEIDAWIAARMAERDEVAS